MPLAEDDQVVQTLAPNGSDQSLRIRVLPRTCGTGDDLRDAHAGDTAPEHVPVDGIAIPREPPRRGVVRKGLDDLLRRPCGGGVFGDRQVDDSAGWWASSTSTNSTRPVSVGTVKKSIDTRDVA
jgi:hypothetical protein